MRYGVINYTRIRFFDLGTLLILRRNWLLELLIRIIFILLIDRSWMPF